MRVSQGGFDVPADKLVAPYPRVVANLKKAIRVLPQVWIFDNDDLRRSFRLVAICEAGKLAILHSSMPAWLKAVLPETR